MSESSSRCPSCGMVFSNATFNTGSTCGRCVEGKDQEPQCSKCGQTFPRLRGDVCGTCDIPADIVSVAPSQVPASVSLLNRVDAALERPPNPRATTNSTTVAGTWDPALATSQQVLSQMHGRFRTSIASQSQQGGPQPAPITPRAMAAPPSVPNVFVSVKSMRLNAAPMKTFEPWARFFSGDTPYSDVIFELRKHVDAECTRIVTPPIRIYELDQLSLRFTSSGHVPIPDTLDGTIYNLYLKHKGLGGYFLSEKDARNNNKAILEMSVWVTHTEPEEAEPVTHRRSTRSKRRHSNEFETQIRTRINTRDAPVRASFDNFTEHEVYQTKFVCDIVEKDGCYTVDFDEETTEIPSTVKIFDSFELGRGKTKVVHKLLDAAGTVLRTAKCHFSDDGTEVPEDQNIIWLKEEMRRSAIAALFAKKFVEMAKAKGVSIHDIQFLKPVILHEAMYLYYDSKTWLSDVFINGPLKKYSGTNKAGSSTELDFAGFTCDALAHWSLSTSGGKRVFVDLQGIIDKVRGEAPTLFLFDVQFHTIEEDSGLGDNGPQGIELFKKQHVCNRICHKIGLPPLCAASDDGNNTDS